MLFSQGNAEKPMTQCFAHNLRFAERLLWAAIVVMAVGGFVAFGMMNTPLLRAQASASNLRAVAGDRPTFEVASIKRNKSGGQP